ncbi:MAG: DNA polymerase III subunit beta [Oligoflexia bacterium]|nr:DNA polymerase III subunit beta [Oligoflexia bacterium]
MKFEIQKSDFLNLLQKTQNIIEKRNTMPILSNALLVAEKGKVSIFATDLEVSIKDEVSANVEVEGKVAVSAKNLFDLVKELSDNTVQVLKKSNNWVELKNKKAVFNIVGSAADEFPAFPQYETKDFVRVQGQILHDMIEKTIYSVSNDETRYHLNGVYFERTTSDSGTSFRMVATDGHRLSLIDKKVEVSLPGNKAAEGVIIPKKGLHELRKLLDGAEGTLEMAFEGSHLVVKRENTVLLIRLIDGKYPNYQQLIPARLLKRIAVSRNELLSSLRRVSLLSNQKSKGITLSITKNVMEIYSNNPEIGDAKEEIDVRYNGDSMKIGFNAKYLMDILNNIQDEEVDIELNDQLSPGILRPANDASYTCVVMPMRI